MIIIPAGRYFLGDPCYVLTESDWIKALNESNYFLYEIAIFDNGIVLAFPTPYGDGIYYDEENRPFCVDSGLIGLVSENLISKKSQNGLIISFDKPIRCLKTDNELIFGNYRINVE